MSNKKDKRVSSFKKDNNINLTNKNIMNPQPQTWLNANIKAFVTVLVVSFSFLYFFICLFMAVKPDPQILIAVVGANGVVLGYWFGSSSGSSKKDDAIVDNLNNNNSK